MCELSMFFSHCVSPVVLRELDNTRAVDVLFHIVFSHLFFRSWITNK